MAVELLTPNEVAERLRCGRTMVFSFLASGELPSLKLGKLRRVRPEDLEAFIERTAQAAEER